MGQSSENSEKIRNVHIDLAVGRPNIYIKATISSLFTFITISLLDCLFMFNQNYKFVIFMFLITIGLCFYSCCINILYVWFHFKRLGVNCPFLVIGFSNKILILKGEEVQEELVTDEIEIRELNTEEKEDYFSGTSVICAKNGGKEIKRYFILGLKDYEGQVLKSNPDRVNEDLVVVYDDEIDEDNGQASL